MYKFFFNVLLLYTIIANITNQGFHSALHQFPRLGDSRWSSIELSVVTNRACGNVGPLVTFSWNGPWTKHIQTKSLNFH